MKTMHDVTDDGLETPSHPAGIAVRVSMPGGVDALAARCAEALGGDPETIGIWYQSAPFDSASNPADRIVRQQRAHPLAPGLRARLTCTGYLGGVTDMVLLADGDLSGVLAEFDRAGARSLPALQDTSDALAGAIDIEFGEAYQTTELAAAVVIVLGRFLDTAALAVDLATADVLLRSPAVRARMFSESGAGTCEFGVHGSIGDVVSQLSAATPEATAAGLESDHGLRSVRIIDYTGAPGVFLPKPAASHDFDIAIHPTSDPGIGRVLLRTRSEEAAEFIHQIAQVLGFVYAQIQAKGPDLRLLDIAYADVPESISVAAVRAPGAGGRMEQRIAAHAADRPSSTAVLDGTASTSFGELEAQSQRIAAGLLQLGVLPGDFVVVAAAKSATLFATMLGIWKCGAAYVPVDIEFPMERLRYIIEDSRARVAVVEQQLLGAVPDSARAVDISALAASTAPDAALPQGLSENAPAYAIYTSGTTGRPKGTVIAHRSVLALIDALTEQFSLSETDVWSAFHSPAFDFSVWEIWGALATGGAVAVVPKSAARDPRQFHELLRGSGVTVLNQTPSAFAHLVSFDAQAPLLDTVRLVILGGEALQAGSSAAWLDRYPANRCQLINMYGITETTVHVTVQPVTKHTTLRAPRSVGHAIAGWHTTVLGPDLRPAPPGFPGEIVVAGAGLALYYSGKPALTATKFVAGPDGQRWYRSGDLGRLRPDGTLEHLGRIDHQVKINGYRIELDEIRNCLRRQPGVRDAIVVCHRTEGQFATTRLDAYLVGDDLDLPELRGAVARMLPSYMRPAFYTVVDKIPLTTNGKADIARLPAPDSGPHQADSAPESEPAPKTSGTQPILTKVWSSVLGVEPSADDNFFLSGGNSLAAIHLSTELGKNAVPMPLSMVYQYPVFKDLLAAIGEKTH
ncbi:non-ribosomal peptide synthetase [Nocardia sp. NBC_01388]|uniref:non-ribosomal peptide synthetase n=1 Tax=Nocardia sp. NBC_01388 TaxID=2903596 RepID=UPI00324EC831